MSEQHPDAVKPVKVSHFYQKFIEVLLKYSNHYERVMYSYVSRIIYKTGPRTATRLNIPSHDHKERIGL